MRILSLVAHPRESSFCHAISGRVRTVLSDAGHVVIHHDLYAEGFDPCLKADEAYTVGDTLEAALARGQDPVVRQHRFDIADADGLFVVHPNWWGKPPAILSGWMDRVLVPGVAYRLSTAAGLPEGLLAIRTALILNTSDTPAQREEKELGDPLEAIWGRCVLPYCGVETYARHVFRPVVGSSDDERAGWLAEAETIGRTLFAPDR
ncbi:NAD(P)H-dependent oxidoreductase [Bosea sp. NPDC055332]